MSKKNKVRDARFSSRPPPPDKETQEARPTSMRPSAPPPKNPTVPPKAAGPSRTAPKAPARAAPVEPEPSPLPSWLNASLIVPAIMILGASGALFVWYRDTHPTPVAVVADAGVSADAAVVAAAVDAAAVVLPAPAVDAAAAPTDAAPSAHTLSGDPVDATHPTPTSPDPKRGVFTLAQATEGLAGSGALVAEIETSMGTFNCDMLSTEAPLTVANFVGLARGKRDFWDPVAGAWARRPFYDGSIFHRVIPRFMIQGGDLLRSGFGGTGYEIRDENVNGHNAAGQLCMANHGPNTNGGQFFITEGATASLDGSYSIFGRCRPTELVGRIARTPVAGERPNTPVFIEHVRIRRATP